VSTRKGDRATETSPEDRPPPTRTIVRSDCNTTQQTAATIYNFQRYWFLKITKSGSPALYTSIFQKTARHKMHGTSSPPHRDINITSAEETRTKNHLDNKIITPMQR
jgi:hypothetical protein